MAKPYSLDLRERVIKAVGHDGLSRREAARRFGLDASTVITWMQRWRDRGGIEPGQMGGHRPKKIAGAWRSWLLERCRDRAFTLRGLISELAERGLKVDYRVVWAFVATSLATPRTRHCHRRSWAEGCWVRRGACWPSHCRSWFAQTIHEARLRGGLAGGGSFAGGGFLAALAAFPGAAAAALAGCASGCARLRFSAAIKSMTFVAAGSGTASTSMPSPFSLASSIALRRVS
jgi:putative transposase